jgi:hypothetical protein
MAERTKADLLAALRSNEDELLDKLSGLSEEDLATGRYESGWNGRQILAHTAAMEWTYPRLIDLAKGPATTETKGASTEAKSEAKTSSRSFEGGVDGYNERQVEKRAGASIQELVDEFRANRETLIAAVEAADDELFAKEIRSAGGIQGSLANVIYALAIGHSGGHVNDIVGSD